MHKTKHPLYTVWDNMKQRCFNSNHPSYRWYGGRGISVCPEWLEFWAFVADVGDRPFEGAVLDRIDSDKDYLPGNVQWITQSENAKKARPKTPKTHCPQGHSYADTGVLNSKGHQECSQCRIDRQPVKNAKRRAKRAEREI